MRLWSINPCYLDSKGLVALWREGLLAQKVLEGKTNGYKFHPQLIRFKETSSPLEYIGSYLFEVWLEAQYRDYNFNIEKITCLPENQSLKKLTVTNKQIDFEFKHLLRKLKTRDVTLFKQLKKTSPIEVYRLFQIVPGEIESWEII